jgi:hypothetical protein
MIGNLEDFNLPEKQPGIFVSLSATHHNRGDKNHNFSRN